VIKLTHVTTAILSLARDRIAEHDCFELLIVDEVHHFGVGVKDGWMPRSRFRPGPPALAARDTEEARTVQGAPYLLPAAAVIASGSQ
jgi:hypothetical protein